jgi:ABC-type branched-subunit amino acid transport system ATPase component/predicted MFS family arabinose efflux permease
MTDVEQELGAPTSAASLTAAVLDEEAARLAEQAQAAEARVLDDQELYGVGDEPMTLRQGVSIGGLAMLSVLALLNAVDQLDSGAVGVLAPDVKKTLGTSDGVIAVATVGGTLTLVAGGLLLGRLADNKRRTTIIGLATTAWGGLVMLTGLVTNALSYFVARALVGLGKSNTVVVQGPVLADAYPIQSRARVYAVHGVVGRVGGLVAPLAVGGLVTLIPGQAAWRWGFVAIAVPTIIIGILSFFLHDPPRGQFEQKDTIGQVISTEGAPPISLGASYQRIMQIKTYKSTLVAFTALGFGWVTVPIFVSLYLDQQFGLDAFERAIVAAVPGVIAIVAVPYFAKHFDNLFRKSPPLTLVLIGAAFIPAGVFTGVMMAMPDAALFTVFYTLAGVLLAVQLTMVGPLFAAANPYYLRAQGTAIGMALILGIGGFGGALVGGILDSAFGLRWTIVLLGVPTNIIGGLLMINGARYLRNDMSLVVEEIRELEAEHKRLQDNPGDIPVLQLRNIDFSYGPVQVLFDVHLDVRRGETLALLGTNGAGKSTVLRVVSGLGIPSRGVVRLNGHNVTLCSPETRVKWGIHQLAGGKAIFGPMSVRENLEMAGFLYRGDGHDRKDRFDRALTIFPELRDRLGDVAGSLSGGQQQMLGLAMALMHDPEILLIDELSLGLAPVMVEQLLGVVDRLKHDGQTMIIVEQSLNVALAVAERAVFMEKGRIRFQGPSQELLERDDLVRAVFLGNEPS